MKTHVRLLTALVLPLAITIVALARFDATPTFAQSPRVLGPFVGAPVRTASFDGDVRRLPVAPSRPPRKL